jgi:1,4-dihydroxy-2-naphthoyl-CoA hydrolase
VDNTFVSSWFPVLKPSFHTGHVKHKHWIHWPWKKGMSEHLLKDTCIEVQDEQKKVPSYFILFLRLTFETRHFISIPEVLFCAQPVQPIIPTFGFSLPHEICVLKKDLDRKEMFSRFLTRGLFPPSSLFSSWFLHSFTPSLRVIRGGEKGEKEGRHGGGLGSLSLSSPTKECVGKERSNLEVLKMLQERAKHGWCAIVGLDIEHYEPGHIVGILNVEEKHIAPNGYLHGGTIVSLADTVCGFGCFAAIDSSKEAFATIELKTNFISTVRDGSKIRCIATATHLGKKTHIWDAKIETDSDSDSDGGKTKTKTLALFRCTEMILPRGKTMKPMRIPKMA